MCLFTGVVIGAIAFLAIIAVAVLFCLGGGAFFAAKSAVSAAGGGGGSKPATASAVNEDNSIAMNPMGAKSGVEGV